MFAAGSPLEGRYDTLDALVTGPDYEVHMDGKVWGFEDFKAWISARYARADVQSSRARSAPAQRRYFNVEGDRDSVYVLYSQTLVGEDGRENPSSAIWRHVFEPAPPGSVPFAVNPSNKIRASYGYVTTDVSSVAKTMTAFESMRKFINGRSDSLDEFDAVRAADDCMIDTFWGGWTSFEDFREGTVGYREYIMNKPDEPIYDADFFSVKRLLHAGGGEVVGVMQGFWVPRDWDRSQLYLASGNSQEKMDGVIETNGDIFYFDFNSDGYDAAGAQLKKVRSLRLADRYAGPRYR